VNIFKGDYLKYPVIQGGMAVRVSTAPLAGAVACAGGVGIIAATGMSVDELRSEIRAARKLACNGRIGINVMYAVRNFAELVKAALQEKVDLVIFGAGFSREIFGWGKEAGIPIFSIVSSARLAAIAEKFGAAAIIAEGSEAGGHLGTDLSVNEIVPAIKSVVKIPVFAAGGLTDDQDIKDVMKLGADGVQLATRFVLSDECTVDDAFKRHYLNAKEEDIVIIKSPVGLPGRAIRNKFSEALAAGESTLINCRNCLKACTKDFCILDALENSRKGLIDKGLIFSGQNVYKMKEILSVKKIFENLSKAFIIWG
jgi:NAD(P)H-dependent flavin oxidoreductase YrpB (nitropropane dioxygenase family)